MSRGRALAKSGQVPARIVVPDLTGMIPAAVLRQATEVGFTVAVADPLARLEDLMSSARWSVVDQDPPGGSGRYQGDTVAVILRRDGGGDGAGDREPRNPLPLRHTDRGVRSEGYIGSADIVGPVGIVGAADARLRGRSSAG